MDLKHPALLYQDEEEFLAAMVPFVREGLEDAEPVVLVLGREELAALRREIGEDAPGLEMADTREWHPHPSLRLRAFHDRVTRELDRGATRVRLAGEPAWPSGPPEFVVEWERYESALNVALAGMPVTLVCAYPTSRLDPAITESAFRTHPLIEMGGGRPSDRYEDPRTYVGRRVAPRSAPSASTLLEAPVDVSAARRLVRERAERLGLDPERAVDVSVAASELLSNAVRHGGGPGTVAMWAQDGRVFCEVSDAGRGIPDALAGYRPPELSQMSGRGLWIARQLVDLLQVFHGRDGTTVRLQCWIA